VWLAVGKSEELYCRLISLYHRANISKQEIHEKAKVYYEELKPIMDEFDTYKIHLCGRLIHMAIHMSINDYVNTVKACDEAIDFFEGKSYVSALALQTFLNQKLICYTQLKKYEAGRDAAIRSNSIIQEGKFNWFKNLEIFFILCLHTQKYQEAYEVFDQVINHKLLKFQPKGIVEIWKINEAYVHYLVILGKVRPRRDDDRFNKFKLGRFLNEVPSFSKEKRRRNIPILIVQILFLILQKRYNDAIDRIETVDKYCYR
jgi:tetratricopeptide (TPR) repeat protein